MILSICNNRKESWFGQKLLIFNIADAPIALQAIAAMKNGL